VVTNGLRPPREFHRFVHAKADRVSLGKETRGTQAERATPPTLNVSDAFQPSAEPPGVTTLILKGVFALEF